MRIDNNKQNITFKYNVVVHFPKKPQGNIRELARSFAINEGFILPRNVGFTRVLRYGKKVAVVDLSTDEGKALAPLNRDLRRQPNPKDRKYVAAHHKRENEFKRKLAEVARSEETTKLEYHA